MSGLVMGIMPAWRLARADVRTLLNESSRSTTSSVATARMMSSLIVGDRAGDHARRRSRVAGAELLPPASVDMGFVTDGRLVVDVRPTRRFADPKAAFAYADDLMSRVRAAVPNAKVGASGIFPLRGDVAALNVELDGEPPDPNHTRGGQVRFVTPGYFDAMGIRLVAGRTFTDDDREGSQRVAVVNRAFVRQYYPDHDPLTGAGAIVAAVTMMVTLIPAVRASRIDPVRALRAD